MAKALHIPLDNKIATLSDTPYTISFVIRKRQQLDSLAELPKDKMPPESIIWDGIVEDLDEWLNTVFDKNYQSTTELRISEIEG